MIIYDLECAGGHRFEGWFPSILAFEEQASKGLVYCAVCGLNTVKRVVTGGHIQKVDVARPTVQAKSSKAKSAPQGDTHVNIDPVTLMKAVDHYVKTHFKNVGSEFAKKAVDIHHGKTNREAIYGTATQTEREKLEEEGVAFTTLPHLPESTEN